MEHIADLEIAEQFLVSRLVAIGIPVVVASKAVTCYHSELAEDDKRAISNEFKKRDCDRLEDCSKYRCYGGPHGRNHTRYDIEREDGRVIRTDATEH